jgi:hypothetical protein
VLLLLSEKQNEFSFLVLLRRRFIEIVSTSVRSSSSRSFFLGKSHERTCILAFETVLDVTQNSQDPIRKIRVSVSHGVGVSIYLWLCQIQISFSDLGAPHTVSSFLIDGAALLISYTSIASHCTST